ncbi:hypothetical protein MAM1_0008d00953 [Mucor ambiguus]|uniref:Uncharacterized protein n=1 Tax=Mucor ambiguus TaxID=91626 RepID=A0A0C9LQJ6_9FUNG|nr:hypothetical protein MAM1_0008d00953 [Mucor ambiguus]
MCCAEGEALLAPLGPQAGVIAFFWKAFSPIQAFALRPPHICGSDDENEGDAVDSKANNNVTANAVEARVINGYAEQANDVALPLTAKYSEI